MSHDFHQEVQAAFDSLPPDERRLVEQRALLLKDIARENRRRRQQHATAPTEVSGENENGFLREETGTHGNKQVLPEVTGAEPQSACPRKTAGNSPCANENLREGTVWGANGNLRERTVFRVGNKV